MCEFYFLDTSAILNGFKIDESAIISNLVLRELEIIKTEKGKSDEIKAKARAAIRSIKDNHPLTHIPNNKKINKMISKSDDFLDIPDHRLLCEAIILKSTASDKFNFSFVTSDYSLYNMAKACSDLDVVLYEEEKQSKDMWKGWSDYHPSDDELCSLYTSPTVNVLNAKTNEYCKIYDSENKLKDVLFWNGNEYEKLKYNAIRNPYTLEAISPRNLEQKMAFNMLQNENIKVKLLTSTWGSGKTLVALNYALEQVHKGKYQKLLYVRNNIIVSGTNDVGFLKGNLREKMSIWGLPLADHVGGELALNELIDQELIEIFPLSHMRGRSLKNIICICDECENMDDKLVTLLLSRIEDGSEIIFCGDIKQIDSQKFEHSNGIYSMIKNLAGDPLFGLVTLIKSERGPVASLCDKMRPPV